MSREINYRLVGKRRSEYTKPKQTVPANMVTDELKSSFGFSKSIAENKKYSARVEVMNPGNKTGFGVNEKESRTIYVVSGCCYVTYEKDGETQVQSVLENESFSVDPGTKHGYASGVAPCTILVIDGGNYEKNWTTLEEPVISSQNVELSNFIKKSVYTSATNKSAYKRRETSNALAGVLAIQAEKGPSSTSTGAEKSISPMQILSETNYVGFGKAKPMGPNGFNTND